MRIGRKGSCWRASNTNLLRMQHQNHAPEARMVALATRDKTSQSPWKPVRRVLLGLFMFGVVFLYLRGYLELVRVNYQISVVEREIGVWEARCDELRKQIDYISSDEYAEKVAREQLGLVKPGEVPFIVAEPVNPDAPPGVRKRAGANPGSARD